MFGVLSGSMHAAADGNGEESNDSDYNQQKLHWTLEPRGNKDSILTDN
jgi:hypothetical protein